MSIDWLLVFCCTANVWRLIWLSSWCIQSFLRLLKHEERLWIHKHRRSPVAKLSIVTDTDNGVLILVANNRKTIDWVLVTIVGKATFLNWLWSVFALLSCSSCNRLFLCADIPLKQVAWGGRSDNDIRIVRIEHRLDDLILTVQCNLWTSLKTNTKDVYQSIRFVHIPFTTFAVRCQENFRLCWRPVKWCNGSIYFGLLLKDELLLQLTSFLQPILVFILVFLCKELFH